MKKNQKKKKKMKRGTHAARNILLRYLSVNELDISLPTNGESDRASGSAPAYIYMGQMGLSSNIRKAGT